MQNPHRYLNSMTGHWFANASTVPSAAVNRYLEIYQPHKISPSPRLPSDYRTIETRLDIVQYFIRQVCKHYSTVIKYDPILCSAIDIWQVPCPPRFLKCQTSTKCWEGSRPCPKLSPRIQYVLASTRSFI